MKALDDSQDGNWMNAKKFSEPSYTIRSKELHPAEHAVSHLVKHVTLASTEIAKLCQIRLRLVEVGKLHLANEIVCVSDLIEKIGKLRVLWGGQSR